MASNSGAPNPRPPAPAGGHPCPHCGQVWLTFQALGGHMSTHTREARRRIAYAASVPPPAAPAVPAAVPAGRDAAARNMMARLAPNPVFWEEYRRGGRRPVEIDFLGLLRAPAPQPKQPAVVNGNMLESSTSSNNSAQPPVNAGEEVGGSESTMDVTSTE